MKRHFYLWIWLATTMVGIIVLWQFSVPLLANMRMLSGETDPRDTIWVPDNYATIQAAIDVSSRSGIIMVRPGTYHENVFFHGCPLQLIGVAGADSTTIEAMNSQIPVITFDADDEYVSRIQGFTITGGQFGVRCYGEHTQPYRLYIMNNIVEWNNGGMGLHMISAWVQGNTIRYNSDAGGIAMIAQPMIVQNVITDNWGADGGGLTLWFASAHPTIGGSPGMGNIITNNVGTMHPWGHDLYRQIPGDVIEARYNTWTVFPPTEYTMYPLGEFNVEGGSGPPRINQDVYVSPIGDNSNSGLDPWNPLRNIHCALARLIPPSPLEPRTIHLGSGVYGFSSNGEMFPIVMISNVALEGNSTDSVVIDASGYSGGLRIDNSDSIEFSHFTLQNTNGVAITSDHGRYHRIRNLNIHHNQGGLVLQNADSVDITNCIIAWNHRTADGGGILSDNSVGRVINSTIYHNTAAGFGGAVACIVAGALDIKNSILWGNHADAGFDEIYGTAIPWVSVTYTDIAGGWTDTGNVDLDPQFVDTLEVSPDLHLSLGSPCIDAGNPAVEYNDPNGSRNDMGAYGGPGAEGWTGIRISEKPTILPESSEIVAVYPNPANPTATIIYQIPQPSWVKIDIYNILGQRIAVILNAQQSTGKYTLIFNGSNSPTGMYFLRLECGGTTDIRKIIILN